MLLMLEDCPSRVRRFQRVLTRIAPTLQLVVWNNAWTMIREVENCLPEATLLSLDHDLEPIDEFSHDEPGTGWDVAQFLALLSPVCPVIIHSSNGERATWMLGAFELEGWAFHRVPPIGDDWIEVDWKRMVQRLLKY